MTAMHGLAVGIALVAALAAVLAKVATPWSEERAALMAFAGICSGATLVVAGLAWWVAR